MLYEVITEEMRKRIYAALEEAKQLGANIENGIAAGYCFGGAAVLEFARSGVSLKGFVTFHGGLTTPEGQDYSTAKGSFLILHGSADTSVTLDDFASLGKQIEAAGITHELISYSGAPHAFTVVITSYSIHYTKLYDIFIPSAVTSVQQCFQASG